MMSVPGLIVNKVHCLCFIKDKAIIMVCVTLQQLEFIKEYRLDRYSICRIFYLSKLKKNNFKNFSKVREKLFFNTMH